MIEGQVNTQKALLSFLLFVSLFGVALSSFFVFYQVGFDDGFAFRSILVGSAFIAICLLGILAALFPSSFSSVPRLRKSNRDAGASLSMHQGSFRAHHPLCEKYSTHILRVGKLKLCATCSGMAVGAVVSLIGAVLYFFGGFSLGAPSVWVFVGAVGVTLGLIQSASPKYSDGFGRFFVSVFFVVGAFLMFASVDEVLGSTSVDLFLVTLSLLWIVTRIAFSKQDHQETCYLCSESCEWNNAR